MKHLIDIIYKKITLLNQTIIESMMEKDNRAIVKNFTETGIKILEADFGFAWWKFNGADSYKLAYKSPGTPYNPTLPREGAGNHIAQKTREPFFDNNVKKENYEFNINRYLKSYIIIPIFYGEHIYGNLVLCYKKRHHFTPDELTLSNALGSTIAQSITVHQLVETNILLDQEKLKTEFIANATHELRTPLAIMKGNVDLALLSKADPKIMKDALQEVNTEVGILSEILQDLALLTSSGKNIKNIMSQALINLPSLLERTVKRLKTMAKEKNITILIETKGASPIFISGDEKFLEKLFLNLIKNGIVYGKEDGRIIIDISKEKDMAKIKVSDDGIGITKEDLPKIFERFYRADKAHSAHGNHSGLGLAIAKWVAEIHGGEIKAESTYGKGSSFSVLLPMAKNPENQT